MINENTALGSRNQGTKDLTPVIRHRFRTRLIRRLVITLAVIAIVMGTQTYLFYSKLKPQFVTANQQFINLIDERRDWALTEEVTDTINDLKLISENEAWQREVDQLQNEFKGYLTSPAEGLDVTLNHLSSMKEQVTSVDDIFNKLEMDLHRLGAWHHDHYGDIIATASRPGVHLWPTSVLLQWIHKTSILDTAQFNRALYHIAVGEVSAGQATLGELRTRLPDSPLRARVLFTQGRLLYGMGRYEESIEVVQESIAMDPTVNLAKRFLEYQLSHGPDEEVEDEHEGIQPLGGVSAGGGILF